MSGFTQGSISLSRPRLALVPLTFAFNAALVWLANGLSAPAIGALVIITTALESYLWVRFKPDPGVQPVFNDTRLTALFSRTSAARQASIRDEATGLFNKWYLELRLDEEAARCTRYSHSMAVLVMRTGLVRLSDMSMDGWQPQSSEIAQRTLQVVRTVDLAACLGPYEFAICLVHCDRDGAGRALDRLMAQMTDFTCDTGIAVYPEDNCEPRALIELARVRSRTTDATQTRAA